MVLSSIVSLQGQAKIDLEWKDIGHPKKWIGQPKMTILKIHNGNARSLASLICNVHSQKT